MLRSRHIHWVTSNLLHNNTVDLIQNGRHFSDDIFKCIFLNENSFASNIIWTNDGLGWRRIYASLGLNQLNVCVHNCDFLRPHALRHHQIYYVQQNDSEKIISWKNIPNWCDLICISFEEMRTILRKYTQCCSWCQGHNSSYFVCASWISVSYHCLCTCFKSFRSCDPPIAEISLRLLI